MVHANDYGDPAGFAAEARLYSSMFKFPNGANIISTKEIEFWNVRTEGFDGPLDETLICVSAAPWTTFLKDYAIWTNTNLNDLYFSIPITAIGD